MTPIRERTRLKRLFERRNDGSPHRTGSPKHTRRTVAGLAVLALAVSLLGHASSPAAGQQAAPVSAAPGGGEHAGVHQAAIDALASIERVDIFEGTGCEDGNGFCPNDPLPRWEMAVWLVRVVDQAEPPATDADTFSDVAPDQWWQPHVERAVELGITKECASSPAAFCPNDPVTRGQMAALLARAFGLPEGAASTAFLDVSDGNVHAANIDRIAAAGITAGCTSYPQQYCPSKPVTRGQMATFLARAAGLVDPAITIPGSTYDPDIDDTALPLDPALRHGALENGLTYYVQDNDRPGGGLDLRLLIKVGSVDETDANSGIAHFVEHMLFNGTQDYPGNELGTALREIGAELGPDLNAYVNHDETALRLTINTDPASNLDVAFHALSQMAHAATFDPKAVEAERGIVLDELRTRLESVSGQIGAEFDAVYTDGTPYEGRTPIGNIDNIESFTSDHLRDFYEKWYRPDNMAVVAVGDWPADELEALISEHFGSIERGVAPPDHRFTITPDPAPSTFVVIHPEQGIDYISLDIPIDQVARGTVGGLRVDVMQNLVAVMVENRLIDAYHRGELGQVDEPHFSRFAHNRGLLYYGTNWQGDDLAAALSDYMSVLLTAQLHGFTSDELARAARAYDAGLEVQLAGADQRQDSALADTYASHFLAGAHAGTVTDRVEQIRAVLEKVTAEETTQYYRWLMQRAGPVIISAGTNAANVPNIASLHRALGASAPGAQPPFEPEIDALFETVPEPVDPVSDGELDILEAFQGHEWTFENGVTVMYAKSDIAAGQVSLSATALGGWSTLEPGAWPLSRSAVAAVSNSGLGDLTRLQITRFLGDSTANVSPFISETTEGFVGSAGTNDVETMFQLLHLYATAPRVDDLAFADALNDERVRASLAVTNPEWQAWIAYLHARYDEQWHHPVLTQDQLDDLDAEALLSTFEQRLGKVDDMVIAIVGDVEESEVERLARHYLGTLPAGDEDTYVNVRPPFPTGVTRVEVEADSTESTQLEIDSATEDVPLTLQNLVAADVLQAAIDQQVFLGIREDIGVSYTTRLTITPVYTPVPGFHSTFFLTLDPERFEEIYDRGLALFGQLVAAGLSEEDFEQAVAVVASNYARVSNGDVMDALIARIHLDDADVPTPAQRVAALETVTHEHVRALANALYGQIDRIETLRQP